MLVRPWLAARCREVLPAASGLWIVLGLFLRIRLTLRWLVVVGCSVEGGEVVHEEVIDVDGAA